MTPEQRIMFNHLMKQLEAMSASGAIPADYATDTTLTNIENAILALKDGEFRILSDPNDNDRLVGLTADMTNPAAPIYIYRYLDNNAVYVGDVNDLQAGTTATSNALLLYREPVYYIYFNAPFVATPEIIGTVSFTILTPTGAINVDDTGSPIAGAYANLAALIVALNSFQTNIEFYELSAAQLDRTSMGVGVIGIRSGTSKLPEQWANNINLVIDGDYVSFDIRQIPDNTTTSDVLLGEAVKSNATASSTNALTNYIAITLYSFYQYVQTIASSWFQFKPANFDSAGRLRVSNPVTIFNSKLTANTAPLLWDDQLTAGSGGSSTHYPDKACVTLAVDAAICTRIRQTFMRFNYQSAKGQLIEITGKLTTTGGGPDIETGFGYGDEKNGIFVKHVDGIISLGLRSYVTGIAVDTWISSADWNMQPFYPIAPGYVQILVIDFQWLGSGDVRVGFKNDDAIIYVHTFKNTNTRETVFMSTPNLPLRYWISNSAALVTDEMDCICSAVIQEGGTEDIGILRYNKANLTPIALTALGTIHVLKAIKLKTTHFSVSNKFVGISISCNSNDNYEWILVKGGTVGGAGTLPFVNETNGSVAVADASGVVTLTGGLEMAGGIVKASGSSGDVTLGVPNSLLMGSTIAGVPETFYLCVRLLTTNADFHASITRREVL